MAVEVKRRRGTTTEHNSFTGAVGETTVDLTKDTVVVHDGATAGGFPLLREDGSNNGQASTFRTNMGLGTSDSPTFAGGTFNGRVDIIGSSFGTGSGLRIRNSDGTSSNFELAIDSEDTLGIYDVLASSSAIVTVNFTNGLVVSKPLTVTDLSSLDGGIDVNGGAFSVSSAGLTTVNNRLEVIGTAFGLGDGIRIRSSAGTSSNFELGIDSEDTLGIYDVLSSSSPIATFNFSSGVDFHKAVQSDNFFAGTTGWQIQYDGDAEVKDLNVRGGLFAKEFIVEQTRVMTDFRMSVGGGRVESVSGSAGSETVTLSDDFSNANPFANGDIVLIQQRTGAFSGTIIKKIYRRVDSISSLDVVLSTTGITWTAGTANDDTGSIAPGDDISIVGHVSDATRDHFIHYDIAGLAVPAIRFFDGITDVDPTATDEIMRVGGLDPGGSNEFSSSLTGDIGIAGKVSGNLAFAVTDSEGLIGGFNFDDTHLWTENAGAAGSFSGIQKRAADSTKVGFWGADDEDGTNANAYFTAGGKLFYDGLTQVIFAQNDQASTTQNDDIGSGPPTGISWQNFAETTAGSSPVTERDTKFKVIWYKRFGIDKLRLLFYNSGIIINSDLNVTNTARVYLYVQDYRTSSTVATANMEWTASASESAESIDLDVSGLSDDTRYEVFIDLYASVDPSAQGGGSTYDTLIQVADDVVILGLTS